MIKSLSDLPFNYFKKLKEAALPDVSSIIAEVKRDGDRALKDLTLAYDGVSIEELRVLPSEWEKAARKIDPGLLNAQREAVQNIKKFSELQKKGLQDFDVELKPGVITGQRTFPLDRIGIYVPGGRFPLFSSLIMAAVPAREAGVRAIAVCTPPQRDGSLPPSVLSAAHLCGVDEVFKCGGAQAVAAMAFGTETIGAVDKIVGPGNIFVSAAKKAVYGQVGIDFIAGPTELLIVADEDADASMIALDLIGQAEHDDLAIPLLVTPSPDLARRVNIALKEQLCSQGMGSFPSLKNNGGIFLTKDLNEAVEAANSMAPEHLALHGRKSELLAPRYYHYGSLFVGSWSAEALGDYSSGLNHILPTSGAARYTGGVNINTFLKTQTILHMKKEGLLQIGPAAVLMAEAEGLEGHARSISQRLCMLKETRRINT